MTERNDSPQTPVQKLRAMLADPDKIIVGPGVYDGFTARIALQAGFDCLYMVCYRPLEKAIPPNELC